ncbi:MAG TPA: winged helix-turn-helix transcriptional regulator [Thermoplasmata archaeon]|nr:winged helix-turn-helix transcriptional regulator [Thermoplasmata archaeon]
MAAVACVVLASLIAPLPTNAAEPLVASLDYSIRAAPYQNSVHLNITGTLDTGIAVDRDLSSPYYETIYVLRGYSSPPADFKIRRSLDGGRTFGDPIPVDLCSGFNNTNCDVGRPGIAVGSGGAAYIVDPNQATGEVAVLRSVDQGVSWLPVVSFIDFGGSVSIATDAATGTVYVGVVDPSGTLLVVRSADGGSTWSPPVTVSSGATATTPSVAVLQENVTVVFLTASNGSCGIGTCAYVTVGASHDGGVTWPSVTAVSPPDVSSASAPSVAVSPDGTFAISWNSLVASGPEATFVSVSRDRGDSFSPPIEVSRYRGMYELELGGSLAFDGQSRMFVAWQSFNETFTGSSIYVASSADMGQNFTSASFSASLQGGGANGSSYQRLSAGPDDHVYLTWYDVSIGGGALFRSVSGEASGDVALQTQLVPGANVDVELRDPATGTVEAGATWTGSPLVFAELPRSLYDVWIHVGNASALAGAIPVRTWKSTAFTVRLGSPGSHPFPWIAVAGVGGAVLVAATAFVAALQHTRLTREEVLQRKVRFLIYEAVREHPGSSFTEVRNAIGLQNGVAAYHLRVLEKQGLIHSEKGRRHRWYYPNGDVSLWRDMPLSPLQKSVLEKVAQDPGIGIRELARSLDRHHAAVAYNVKGMAREGLLRTQRTGRKVQCFPLDESGTA